MTPLERAKIEALARHVHIPDWGYGALLIRNLRWRLEYDPRASLSLTERYLLDGCCWHYRRKLGGLVAFELPTEAPARADYFPVREDIQGSLL
ncbi:MAG: hypothetical protein H6974_10970 [Gammaproteobacteria bacterium]|nr:hypothetical protein [Gammaproteobacteria bacterium]